MKNKILVIAVHPDDETLGCGGTLLKHKANGDEIHWLICTTIDKSHSYYEKREEEIEKVSKLYNFDSMNNLKLKTMTSR
nr:PIG-L [uncultured Clostridium sp.]